MSQLRFKHVCAIAPNILSVRCIDGHVQAGRRVAYTAQPGDAVTCTPFLQRWVMREGTYMGCLNGPKLDQIFLCERADRPDLDPAQLCRPEMYRIASDHGKVTQYPIAVYRKSKPADLARTGPDSFEPVMEHMIYLVLKRPLIEDGHYSLNIATRSGADLDFVYSPNNQWSEAIHVSHIGFRPDDPAKVAFLSCWMGTGGGYDYSGCTEFSLVDTDGATVFRGPVSMSKSATDAEDALMRNYTGTDVYLMDFSGFSRPGMYQVCVATVGRSYPFPIGVTAWESAFKCASRAFYHQRSGIALGPPYTDYHRPRIFHPEDGTQVYASGCTLMDSGNGFNRNDTNFGNLVREKTDEIVPEAWGAYCDAGDWDRRIQHLIASRYLLDLVFLLPTYFHDLSLNIPESQNPTPDVISEALYNVDGYRRLQCDNGGIRGGIESSEHPIFGERSWEDSLPVMAYAPDIWSSYFYASTAALAAFVLQAHNKQAAEVYKKSALKAMAWAEQALDAGQGSSYRMHVIGARQLAAVEMYRLTGDESARAIFENGFLRDQPATDQPQPIWAAYRNNAAWVCLMTRDREICPDVRQACQEYVIDTANHLLSNGNRSAFRWIKPDQKPPGEGVLSAPLYAVELVRAHYLTRDDQYLRGAVLACQTGLGANPLNICYTTGLGHVWPQHPMHLDSRFSGVSAPPGLTVLGPRDTERSGGWGRWALDLIEPMCWPRISEWPAIERFWDVFWNPSMCEFTIHNPLAQVAYVWGYLAARATKMEGRSTSD